MTDVLSDLVDVSLDGSHDDASLEGSGTGGHEGLEDFEGHLHGLGGGDDLREEDLGLVEPVADDFHSLSESVSDDLADGDVGVDGLLGGLLDELDVPGLDRLLQICKDLLFAHFLFLLFSDRSQWLLRACKKNLRGHYLMLAVV